MLRPLTFGHDGDDGLGERLLRDEKTANSSLAVEYLAGDPLPRVGELLTLTDNHDVEHGTVETTRVAIIPLRLVDDDIAAAEGEGFADADHWRRAHLEFWQETRELIRADAGDPVWELRDCEPVVVEWFRLIDV